MFEKKLKENMVFKIVLTNSALIDTFDGIEWYEKQTDGLGKRFYQAIQKVYKTIRQNPYFQIRYADVRCLPLQKFPYMVHFVVEEERKRIVILGIICTHRDPKTWEKRAK
jgi:toxin ParE1/3/4